MCLIHHKYKVCSVTKTCSRKRLRLFRTWKFIVFVFAKFHFFFFCFVDFGISLTLYISIICAWTISKCGYAELYRQMSWYWLMKISNPT